MQEVNLRWNKRLIDFISLSEIDKTICEAL